MFKLLAGILLISISLAAHKESDVTTSNICFIGGIALIGAGLDTIFHKK